MKFRFSLAVWGEWHIDQFIRNALPSLKAPGNLDAIDYVIAVHTRPADVERLRAALEGVNAELLAPIADDTAGDQTTANVTIQGYAARDIQAAVAAGEVLVEGRLLGGQVHRELLLLPVFLRLREPAINGFGFGFRSGSVLPYFLVQLRRVSVGELRFDLLNHLWMPQALGESLIEAGLCPIGPPAHLQRVLRVVDRRDAADE